MNATLLIHCRHAPYGSSLGRAAIDLAMAAAVFDQAVELLFSGEGVWQLVAGQTGDAVAQKTASRLLESLPLYGIERLFVDAQDLRARGLGSADLGLPAAVLERTEVRELMARAQRIFGF